MERKDIEEQYKWDKSLIYKSFKDWIEEYEIIQDQLEDFDNTMLNQITIKPLYEVIKLKEHLDRQIDKLYKYSILSYYEDTRNKFANRLLEFGKELLNKNKFITTNFENELKNINLAFLMEEDPKLFEYKFYLEKIGNKTSKDLTSEETSKLSTEENKAYAKDFRELLKKSGQSDNSEQFILENQETFHELLIGHAKKHEKIAELHGFTKTDHHPAALLRVLENDGVQYDTYKELMDQTVSPKQISNRIEALKSVKAIDLLNEAIPKYSIEQIKEYLIENAKTISSDYQVQLEKTLSGRTIEWIGSTGLSVGRSSTRVKDIGNFLKNYFDNSIAGAKGSAHEIGHAVYGGLADRNNFYNSNLNIIMSEIGAKVSEYLLLETMLEMANNEEEKHILVFYIEMLDKSLFAHPQLSALQTYMFNETNNPDKNDIVSINKQYNSLNRQYYGDEYTNKHLKETNWMLEKHLSNTFYSYRYTLSTSIAQKITDDIIIGTNDMGYRFTEMMKLGSSLSFDDLVKGLGINIYDGKALSVGYDVMHERARKIG